jgi:hypothetical protein
MLDLMKFGLLRALGMGKEPRLELPFWCDAMAKHHRRIARSARGMSRERIVALCQGVAAIEQRNLPGAIVEVGDGNGVIAAALALLQCGSSCRTVHLFDPSFDLQALVLDLMATSYPWEKFVFVPGQVEATLPDEAPRPIALLHLGSVGADAAAYALEHLFPRLVDGGVLLVDAVHADLIPAGATVLGDTGLLLVKHAQQRYAQAA